jgi:tetratricopeptide (TPR) repeat protein
MHRTIVLVAFFMIQLAAFEPARAQSKPSAIDEARARERVGDWEGAMSLLTKAIERDGETAVAYFNRGRIGFNAMQVRPSLQQQVESDLTKALELNPAEATWWTVRAEFFARTNHAAKAVDDLTEALKLRPGQAPWLLQRGLAYSQLGKLKEAAADNEAAAKLKPAFAFAWINATDVYVRMGDDGNAVRTGEQAIKVGAGIPMAQLNCGRAYLIANRFDSAEERLNQALTLIPNFPQAYFYRAELNTVLGNSFAARNDYYACAVLNPTDLQSRMLYAAAERACGNYEAAVEVGLGLCQLAPKQAEYQLELAQSWASYEEVENALAALAIAGETKDLLAEVESLRGDILWQQGDLAAARKAYQAAMREHDKRVAAAPNDMQIRFARATFLAHQRQDARALVELLAVVENSPNNYAAANALAWLYATTSEAKIRNPQEAIKLSSTASKILLDKNGAYLDTKAAAYAASGSFDEAIRLQIRAIELATPLNVVEYQRHLLAFTNRRPWTEPADKPAFAVSILPDPLTTSIKPARFEAARAPDAPLAERTLAEVIEMAKHGVVLLEHDSGGGSGMILSSEGHVLTCAHALPARGALKITWERTVGDKRESSTHTAEILAVDHVRDLALVKMKDARDLPTIRLGLKTKVVAGDKVVAIGNPLAGGKGVLRHVATDGIVSNAAQPINVHKRRECIQTTASVSPGCSGGPLLNMRGEVIGVIVAKIDAAQAGFAIPMSDVMQFLELTERK